MLRRCSFVCFVSFLACFLPGCGASQLPTAATPTVANPGEPTVSISPVAGAPPEVAPAKPLGAIVAAFTVDQPRLRGGDTAVASITLVSPAPAGGTVVSLTSSDRDVRPPQSIRVAEGATLGMFQIPSSAPHADTLVRLTAVVSGETQTLEIVLLLPRPGAHGDRYEVSQGETLVVRTPGVLDNDVRRNGHDLTAVLAAPPLSGQLTLATDGGFTYRPAAGFTGDDRFIYVPMDGEVAGDRGTVVITVTPPRAATTPPASTPPGSSVSNGTLSVSGSPLLLASGGGTRTLTVTNTSSVTVTNVASNLAGTALVGKATETGNTCASLAPSASCTLTFSGTAAVAETTFPIQGSNTASLNAAIEVATITVGGAFRGGIIFQVNGDGVSGKIAATANNHAGILWGGIGTVTNAQSDTNGTGNTTTVVAALGTNGGVAYAAQVCDALSVNSGAVNYTDWYLPAKDELNVLYTNRVAVGGFIAGTYWSSTEFSGNPTGDSWAQVFGSGLQGFSGKTNINVVRCIRAF